MRIVGTILLAAMLLPAGASAYTYEAHTSSDVSTGGVNSTSAHSVGTGDAEASIEEHFTSENGVGTSTVKITTVENGIAHQESYSEPVVNGKPIKHAVQVSSSGTSSKSTSTIKMLKTVGATSSASLDVRASSQATTFGTSMRVRLNLFFRAIFGLFGF